MYRRRVLCGTVTAVALATAGCASDGTAPTPATDGGEPTDGTPTDPPADLRAVTFAPREACPDPGGATVRFDTDPISVVGCVVGKNGCTRPRVASVDRDPDAGAVTIVVAAVEERAAGEACTEALVNLGYEVGIDSDDPPTRVRIVHDDVDGRRTVADATR